MQEHSYHQKRTETPAPRRRGVLRSRRERRRSRRRGSVLLLTAGATIFIMACAALAVDYGLLVADANRMQRACDAAALAGATKLKVTGDDNYDTYQAKSEAILVAAQNGATVNWNDITLLSNNTQIRVPAATTRTFFFARAIGRTSGSLTRRATASVAPGGTMSTGPSRNRVAPIGITWETYNAYSADRANSHDLELIRQNKQTFGLDDMVLFDLRNTSAKSGPHMQDQLTGAENESTAIGDYETTLNAAQPSERKKLTDGLDELFGESEGPPWNDNSNTGTEYNDILNGTSPRDNPRVVYIIVTPSTTEASNGTYDTQIQAYVPVYIESYYETTSSGEQVVKMRVRFLPPGTAGDEGIRPDPNASWAGIRVISLID